MVRWLLVSAFLTVAWPLSAQDKPRTLAPAAAAAGTLMMFDGVTTFGWKTTGPVAIRDGWMIVGGKQQTTITSTTALPAKQLILELEWDQSLPEGQQPRLTLNEQFRNQIPQRGRKTITTDPQLLTRIQLVVPAGTVVKMGDVHVEPHLATALFNGKNLDGWTINAADPKRMASKWTVTQAGELRVQNGPGDLVSEQQFANFLLQLECKTSGPALNSGVFFRCIPGQYQNGYEAQIQNAYKNNDRSQPADFGTGAIYRRVPARKVVSNDNEWFTMTVVAHDRHIATWVNGYPTVDWTDERNDHDNPRQGYRAAKGPISLQGHDPTTDILFRNIRITEFPSQRR
ncbi:MAG: DUF1080 domain-containing protein [Gemmataceae bacterium]|nr:DUF1080 domain-containing protein [Gemmata sp.]MDW8196428.1 DUF1080 domain-containing protein [Gemmataceae bacterium]